ncbi:unnamed protein product [Callosobruchus maculatus]|uniref:Uncharacterized protein n=1 Tax=Callosobruchus maculatus TaxID=64391 RepID=A0A653D2J5_CALMS|nr:unnamed protein product [Callosobruchus maculatus]
MLVKLKTPTTFSGGSPVKGAKNPLNVYTGPAMKSFFAITEDMQEQVQPGPSSASCDDVPGYPGPSCSSSMLTEEDSLHIKNVTAAHPQSHMRERKRKKPTEAQKIVRNKIRALNRAVQTMKKVSNNEC